uniref:Transposase n=1 Tax=Chenopodium quinoa TaxID=63459 RepID=A0A803MBY7_CHEQI
SIMLKEILNSEDKFNVLIFLLKYHEGDDIKRGAIKEAMEHFNLKRKCVSSVWNEAKKQKQALGKYKPCTNYHPAGRKRITVPIHTNAIKPPLTEANKLARLKWILGLIMGSSPWKMSRYFPMYDFVHIDEKWFKLTKKNHRYYIAKNEKGVHRTESANSHGPKFMFTAACAKPRYNDQGECYFDGRIGIFPFTTQEAAKRKSKNREKRTLISKPIAKVTKEVTRRMLIDQIVPAIKAKWPNDGTSRTIYIQQDNAR